MSHRHSVTEDPVKLAGVAAIAAAVGAMVALLFTPRSGNQVRSGLKRRAAHLKDEVQDKITLVVDDSEDVVDEAKQRLQTTASKVAKDAKTTATKAKTNTKAVKSRAKSTTTAAKKPASRRSSSQ